MMQCKNEVEGVAMSSEVKTSVAEVPFYDEVRGRLRGHPAMAMAIRQLGRILGDYRARLGGAAVADLVERIKRDLDPFPPRRGPGGAARARRRS